MDLRGRNNSGNLEVTAGIEPAKNGFAILPPHQSKCLKSKISPEYFNGFQLEFPSLKKPHFGRFWTLFDAVMTPVC